MDLSNLAKIKEQTEEVQNFLESRTIKKETDGITIEMNLLLKVVSIEINQEKVSLTDVVKLEILLKNAYNETLSLAQVEVAKAIGELREKNPNLFNFE